MKRTGLTLPLLAATLFLFAGGSSRAQEMMNATPSTRAAQRAEELLKRFDKNGDGKLDDDERADAKEDAMHDQIGKQMTRIAAAAGGAEAFRTRVLEFFDKDRDGRLDDEERATATKFAEERAAAPEAARTAVREEFLKRFDKNGNAKIDAEEREGLQDFFRANPTPNPIPAVAASSGSETTALEAVLRNAIVADAKQRERFDRDRDGKLSDEEWIAARPQILRAIGTVPGPMPSTEQERERLQRVADEVARRRKVREEAAQQVMAPK